MKTVTLNRRLLSVAALAVATSTSAVATPVAAAAAATDRGDHGAQARCMYTSVELPGWSGAMRLNRIRVMPPTLLAVGGAGEVGWRFVVQRRYDVGNWKRIFASRIQRATATPSQPAAFSSMSAHINSPLFISDGQGGFRSADYRVVLKLYWFDAAGSIARLERHRMDHYDVFRDGNYLWTDRGLCTHGWIFD